MFERDWSERTASDGRTAMRMQTERIINRLFVTSTRTLVPSREQNQTSMTT